MRKSSTRICDLLKEPPQGEREGGKEAEYILPRILRRSKKCSKDCMGDRGRERERERDRQTLRKSSRPRFAGITETADQTLFNLIDS